MKNTSNSGIKRESAPNGQQRRQVKIEKAFGKAARQGAFIESVTKLPMDEAISRAKLIANVNPSDFRIIRMPG